MGEHPRNRAQRRAVGQIGNGGFYHPRLSPRALPARHPLAAPLNECGEVLRDGPATPRADARRRATAAAGPRGRLFGAAR